MQLSATARKYGSSGLIPLSDNMKHKKLVRSSSLLLSSVKQRNPLPNWSKRAKGSSMDGTLLFLGEFFSAEDQDHTSASGNCHKSRGEGSASRAGVFRFIRIIYRWIASIGFLLIWEEAVLLIWISS